MTMASATRIVLLHATPIAMAPIQTAFASAWPDAEIVNLLDDGLTIDRARETNLSSRMIARFVAFGQYGAAMDADGILVTCSAFGPAIDQLAASLDIPVLKPNEAMFHAAVAAGNNIGMLATFGPSVPTMTAEFDEYVANVGSKATLTTVVVPEAIDRLRAGDAETHNRLVAEYAPQLANCDSIMLAHFSTSRAAPAVRAAIDTPVFTAPEAAVTRMRALVESRG
jgi:Asp/Glu/hydantoin racemase